MRKKISAVILLLIFTSLVFFFACSGSSRQVNAGFDNFTDELFRQEVQTNAITMHYTLKDPDTYGIHSMPNTLGTYSTDSSAACVFAENCLAVLRKYKYSLLSDENKLTYDILENYLETALEGAPYTLYDEPLSPMTGAQAQLPVLLSEYRFYSVNDIDTYLTLLENVPEYMDSLISFEQAKSDAGLFMASYTADDIIKECNSFVLMGNTNYLYSTFNSRIEEIEDLSQEAKDTYIAKNEELIENAVFPAYTNLKNALSALRTTGKNQNGLCYLPDGTGYYEYLVKSETGSSRSITELQDLTRAQMTEDLTVMQEILTSGKYNTNTQDNEIQETSALILEDSNPAAILNELKNKLDSTFPEAPQVNTQIKYVQKEMEEYLSPAFYMVPAIDNTENNIIYINQGHIPDDLELYTTLAHEGYPGHLYQTVYFASTDPAPIRSILNFGGYTEGWATYSEMASYYYTSLDKSTATLLQRNSSVILGLYALADMGIHYDGWSLLDTVSFFREYGITDNETIENIYDLIIADPANYLKYYIGYVEFLELKRGAIEQWGEDFSQKRFHKAVLDIGPAPFDILRKYVL